MRASALAIPFKQAFAHASASRSTGQSLWVEVSDDVGHRGFGEGCPREYVTGETLENAIAFVAQHQQEWLTTVTDCASLSTWVDEHRELIDRHPAAWSAVELALLDLFARAAGCSVEHVLGLPDLRGQFRYSAVLGDASKERFAAELSRYMQAGFTDFKIKLSGDLGRDTGKVEALREAGIASAAVRADANNLWPEASQAIDHLEALDFQFKALEEPLGAGDYAGMARIAHARCCAIIVDESVLRIAQLNSLCPPTKWIVNLRISKMGGLLRSLRMSDEIRRRGLAMIVGAHVGESSVLARAALSVANASGDILVAQEGAFGTHLLAHDVVEQPLMFAADGTLDIGAVQIGEIGFGLDILDR